MIYLSTQVDHLLGNTDGRTPDVVALTVTFFLFEFLAATQDIAVDGWALTMLSRENVGYASTCNSVGQTAGYFLGNVLFLALESADFCNKYLRFEPQPRGIVTLSGSVFIMLLGLLYVYKSFRQCVWQCVLEPLFNELEIILWEMIRGKLSVLLIWASARMITLKQK